MSKREITPVAAELIAAKKRIVPESWQRGCYDSMKLCALDAIGKETYYDLDEAALTLFGESIPFYGSALRPAAQVNDYIGFEAVHRMYDHAIQRALSEGK